MVRGGVGGKGGTGRGGKAADAPSNGTGYPGLEYGAGGESPRQGFTGSASGTVAEQDTLIFVGATHLEVKEGSAGTTDFTFNINRIGSSAGSAAVNWELTPGAGLKAAEFVGGKLPSGTVHFKAGGPDSIAVTFKIKGDRLPEADKAFSIDLTSIDPSSTNTLNYGYGTKHVQGHVLDDDPVSFVVSGDDEHPTLSTQSSKAGFLSAFAGLESGDIMKVALPGLLGDIGARTVKADNVVFSADGPFDAKFTLADKVKTFSLLGTASVDVIGSKAAGLILGNAGDNVLKGLGGVDLLSGGAGDDKLYGGDGIDVLQGGKGADLLDGGEGVTDEASYASAAAGVTASLVHSSINKGEAEGDTYKGIETLFGSDFNDKLAGNGSTRLFGDKGNDTFLFQAELGDGKVVDRPLDYGSGNDRISLDNDVFTVLDETRPGKHLFPNIFVDAGTKGAKVGDAKIIYDSKTGDLAYDHDGAGSQFHAVRFAHFDKTGADKLFPHLSAADFIVV